MYAGVIKTLVPTRAAGRRSVPLAVTPSVSSEIFVSAKLLTPGVGRNRLHGG